MTDRDKRYEKTIYIVEANRFEQSALWQKYSKTTKWEEDLGGYLPKVGHINNRPICISVLWAEINGVTVMFYHPTSMLVCYDLIERWLKAECKNLVESFDSDDFHRILNKIEAAK